MRRSGWILSAALVCSATAAFAGEAPRCPHPYFPMADGLTLTYRAGKSEVTVRFSDVKSDTTTQSGTLHMQHKGRDGVTEATCSPEGIRTQLGGLEGAALSMSGMDVKVVSSEGIAMPPPDQMIAGAKWSNTLGLELRPPADSSVPFGVIKTTFKKDAIIEGTEKIEVAGKTWDAVRVKNIITAMAGTSGERSMESVMWLAPDVGILRIQTGDTVDFELLKVDRKAQKKRPSGAAAAKRAK